jgi:hypothetical protein
VIEPGLSIQLTDSVGKRIDQLRDLLPNLDRLALIGNFVNPTVARELAAVQTQGKWRTRSCAGQDPPTFHFEQPTNLNSLSISRLPRRLD